MSNKVPVKLIDNAKLPVYASDLAAGCDFYALEGGTVLPDTVIGLKREKADDGRYHDIVEGYSYNLVECRFNDPDVEELTVKKHSIKVRTGVLIALDPDLELELRGRSGLGFKFEIIPFNGTIDADYRGEIVIKIFNHSNAPFSFEAGERIAQGVIKQIIQAQFEVVDELPETKRGEGGLGHTGMK